MDRTKAGSRGGCDGAAEAGAVARYTEYENSICLTYYWHMLGADVSMMGIFQIAPCSMPRWERGNVNGLLHECVDKWHRLAAKRKQKDSFGLNRKDFIFNKGVQGSRMHCVLPFKTIRIAWMSFYLQNLWKLWRQCAFKASAYQH